MRGLWVVRTTMTSRDRVREMVDFASENGYNVLFVQVRGRGEAYYRSSFVPGPEGYPAIPGSYDPLQTVIDLAHARGIEVHAWMNMYLTWSAGERPGDPDHPLNRHPDWFMVSKEGTDMGAADIDDILDHKTEGRYLSPGNDEVRLYLVRVASEIVERYAVDGIHLDYVRYPNRDYDFSTVMRDGFHRRYGIDAIEASNGNEEIDPLLKFMEAWVDYRVSKVDAAVSAISQRVRLVDRHVRVSAAVKPRADEAYYEFGQNWAGWLREGTLDFAVPMSYFRDTATFRDVLETSLKQADPRRVVAGIGAYTISPGEALRQVDAVRDMGVLGWCVFSYTTFRDNAAYMNGFHPWLPGDRGVPPDFKPYIRAVR